MPALRTDLLLADNTHARWIRRTGEAKDFVIVQEMHAQPAAPPRTLAAIRLQLTPQAQASWRTLSPRT